jgi:putative peptidoglycan lipid II flippase
LSLLKNFATVGGLTLSSRVLGFIRDSFLAAAIGTGAVADAFVVAFRLPNLFRRLFAEGAFSSAFVPLFAGKLEAEGKDSAKRFAEESLSALGLALLVLTVAAELAMAALVLVLAPGFSEDPAKFDLTVLLSRIAFPYLALVSLVSLYSGVLNGLDRFAAAAFSPALLNTSLIAALVAVFLLGYEGTSTAGVLLAAGITVGGVLQLGLLLAALARAGFPIAFRRPRLTANVKRLAVLAGPSVIAGGVVQINTVVGTMIASTQAGAVSWLYFADRVYQLPLGIVGIAVGVVLLPDLAKRVRAGDLAAVNTSQNRSLEFAMALTLPAAAALTLFALPITIGLFQRGAFSAADSVATAAALAAFGAGLPAFVLTRVFQPAFFARENTRTPMIFSAITVAANVIISLALFPLIGHVGVAIATSASSWLNVALLYRGLRKADLYAADARVKRTLARVIAAVAVMVAALYGAEWLLAPWFAAGGLTRIGALLAFVAAGGAVYAIAAVLFGAVSRSDLRRVLKRGR